MPIANVAARGALAYAALGTSNTFPLTSPETVAVGNTLIAVLAMDNSFTGGASQLIQLSFTSDVGAGAWIPLGTVTNDPGAANEGVQIYAWYCKLGRTLAPTETLTLGAAVAVGRAAVACREFSGVLVRGAPDDRTTGTGNGTTATAPAISHATAGDMVIGVAGMETNAAITGDADATDGAWATSNTFSSNSGVAATSIDIMWQFKVTTGTTAQNWSVTWAGAADWAAMAIVVPAEAAPADPEFPQENPNYPCVAGPEYLPTRDALLPVDTGTGYNVAFQWPPSSNLNTLFVGQGIFVDPNIRSQHIVSMEMTDSGRYLASLSDDIVTVVLPLREVATTDPLSGAATSARLNDGPGPAGSALTPANALAALSAHGGDVVWFDGSLADPSIALFFDPTILANYPGYRVMRVGLRYRAWKDDSSPAIPGEGFNVEVVDTVTVRAPNTTGASALYGSWLTPDYERNAQPQTRWLGETNLINRNSFNPIDQFYNDYEAHPFTISDLNNMQNASETFYIRMTGMEGFDLLQTTVYLDYIEMVVELSLEHRLMVGSRIVSNMEEGYEFDQTKEVIMHFSRNPSTTVALDFADNSDMVFTVRQAFPATSSDRFRANPEGEFEFTFAEALGPSLQMMAVEQLRPLNDPYLDVSAPQFFETVLVNGLPEIASIRETNYIYSASVYDPINLLQYGPYWVDAYQMAYPSFRWVSGLGYEVDQTIRVDGATTFDRIRLFVRPGLLTTDPIDIVIEQPLANPIATATVTVADWTAAEEPFQLGDVVNYREVIVELDAPITPAAGEVFVNLSSSELDEAWDVAGLRSSTGNFAYEWFEDEISEPDDFGITLLCEMEDPDLTIGTTSIANSATSAPCTDAAFDVPEITLANADQYDHIVIERSIAGEELYSVVQVLEVVGSLTVEWIDYGAPWDVASDYRITGWRHSDRQSRSAVVTGSTVTAPAEAAFGLTSYDNEITYVYTPVSPGDLEVTWTPLNPIDTVQLHGVDFQIALRAPEERGLSVTVTVAVRNFDACVSEEVEDVDGELLGEGGRSLNPKPFDALRQLERECRLQLALPGGHTRWVSLDLGSMSVRTVYGAYLAEITLTDLAPLEDDPYGD